MRQESVRQRKEGFKVTYIPVAKNVGEKIGDLVAIKYFLNEAGEVFSQRGEKLQISNLFSIQSPNQSLVAAQKTAPDFPQESVIIDGVIFKIFTYKNGEKALADGSKCSTYIDENGVAKLNISRSFQIQPSRFKLFRSQQLSLEQSVVGRVDDPAKEQLNYSSSIFSSSLRSAFFPVASRSSSANSRSPSIHKQFSKNPARVLAVKFKAVEATSGMVPTTKFLPIGASLLDSNSVDKAEGNSK